MEENYRTHLVNQIKGVGQELIDRAEQMVSPDLDLISDFNISVSFDQEGIPVIEFSTSVISKNCWNLISNKYNKKGN